MNKNEMLERIGKIDLAGQIPVNEPERQYYFMAKAREYVKKLKEELTEYKFIAKAGMMNGWSNKPEDKNNHGINALEWITMELPSNPKNLIYGIYNKKGNDITKQQEAQKTDEQKMLDWMFSDNTYDDYNSGPYGADYD